MRPESSTTTVVYRVSQRDLISWLDDQPAGSAYGALRQADGAKLTGAKVVKVKTDPTDPPERELEIRFTVENKR